MVDIEVLYVGGGISEEDGDELMIFELSIFFWWQCFVDWCMKWDDWQIFKCIFIKMNQILSEERVFVVVFIVV